MMISFSYSIKSRHSKQGKKRACYTLSSWHTSTFVIYYLKSIFYEDV